MCDIMCQKIKITVGGQNILGFGAKNFGVDNLKFFGGGHIFFNVG